MQIELDETLFLAATKFLADRESGEAVFAFHRSSNEFLDLPAVRERFAADVGRAMSGIETTAIDTYISSVHNPTHYSVFFDSILDKFDALDDDASRCCRRIAWAFMAAWMMRYGGFRSDLVRGGDLVDPSEHNPKIA